MSKPQLSGDITKAFKFSILVGILLVVMMLIMPVAAINSYVDSNPDIIQVDSNDTNSNTNAAAIGTRSRSRAYDEVPNDYYYQAEELASNPATVIGTITQGNHDWFVLDLAAGSNVDNLSVSVPLLSGMGGTLFIYLYGWFDIDQDGEIDHNNLESGQDELILMKLEGFSVGSPGSLTAFGWAFNNGPYYIQLSLSGTGTVNYELYVDASQTGKPIPSNQYPARAKPLASGSKLYNQIVDMDKDSFDWYYINSPNIDHLDPDKDPIPEGVNFSIKVELESSLPGQAEPMNGDTVDFFTELIMIIMHEGSTAGTYTKGLVKKASIQYTSELPRSIFYYEVKAQPEGKRFDKTYIGFYAHTLGRSREDPSNIWYGTNALGDGWVKYSIMKVEALSVYRPKLVNAKVESMATKTEWGRSYDEYLYSINYYQKNRFGPHEMSITINGKDTRPLVKADPSKKDYNKKDKDGNPVGVKYIFQYSGLMLGEGIYHNYQIHSRDKNAYAIGSVELGTTNYGPYISNNFKPYVKPTAVREYTLLEDSDPEYLPLTEIFEDSENDSLTFTIWNEAENEFSTIYDNERIIVRIIDNSILEFAPKENMSGEDIVKLNVSDANFSLQPPLNFTIIIESVNDPPVVLQHLGSIQMEEDETYTDINLNTIFSDLVEQTQLQFNHTETPNFNIEIKANGQLILTPRENWFGTDKITFKANDGFMTITDVLKITVNPVNDPPFLEFDDVIEVNQSEWCNLTFYANDSADGDVLTFESDILEVIPELLANASRYHYNFDATEGKISFFTTNDLVGTYSITVTVEDPFGDNNVKMLTLKIVNINDAPLVKIKAPLNNDAFLTSDKITFTGASMDPDENNMNYLWISDIDGELGRALIRKDYTLSEGIHNITFSVTDSEGAVTNATILIRIFKESPIDTDRDGIFDYWEYILKLDPMDSRDADRDPDGDGYTNLEEFYGNDGSPYGDDSTNPWNHEEHPSKHILPDDEYSERMFIYIGLFAFLIIILISLFFFMVIKSKKERALKEKRAKDQEKKESAKKFQKDMYGIDTAIEDQESPPEIRCHKCGEAIPVYSPQRPVAIVCQRCDTRSVLYD